MSKIIELLNEALKMSEGERADLAERLLLSIDGELDGASRDEFDAAWTEEIDRRSDLVHQGKCQLLSHEEVLADVRKRLAELRSS